MMHRWGGLLCGLGALFAVVVLVWLALHIIDRRASRKAGAAPDAEKGHKRQVQVPPPPASPTCNFAQRDENNSLARLRIHLPAATIIRRALALGNNGGFGA